MTHFYKTSIIATAAVLSLSVSAASAQELNVYNWSDYIAEDTIANFEAETGIKVTYDTVSYTHLTLPTNREV